MGPPTADATTAAIEDAGTSEPRCPKRMVYGPCGGVRDGGGCEVDDRRCPFVDRGTVRWAGPAAPAPVPSLAAALGVDGPVIVTDLRVRPFDVRSIASVTQRLSRSADAVLVGEHHVRPDYPPAMMAQLVREAGGTPWVTLTCRDRNRVVLEAELAALAHVDAAGVHCVTGDSRARSVRDDATQVFDLDGTRLTALAAEVGLCASVAATPAAPPTHERPTRVLEKQRAGAGACFVNHAGGSGPVAAFVAAARGRGVTIPFIPCVAVITDRESLMVLERFPGLVVDPEVRRSVLEATDGREAGVTAAVDEALRMLAIEGVAGVNLSGSATAGPEDESAAIMDEVADRIRERLGVSRSSTLR
jgi:5,10-methylenetetrahydrofolate reductase